MRFLLLIALLVGCLLSQVAAESRELEIQLRTSPPGALVKRGLDIIGNTSNPVRFKVGSDSRSVKLTFELEGFKPTERVILVNDLAFREVYPPPGLAPINLEPESLWGVVVWWVKRNPLQTLSLILILVLSVLYLRVRKREAASMRRWLFRLEHILEGSRNFHTTDEDSAIFKNVEELVSRLMGEHFFVARQRPGGGFTFLGAEEKELSTRAVRSLFETVLEQGDVAYFEDLERSGYTPPVPTMKSVLLALCRSGEEHPSVLILWSEESSAFLPEHKELLALIAHQASSALVKRTISEKLRHNEKMSAIGQMAAGLAHELNNPLGAIQLAVDSALDLIGASPKSAGRVLSKASGAVARARTLNENFLRFTGEAAASPKEAVDLGELIGETTDALEHTLDGVQVESRLATSLLVEGNQHDLEILLDNLFLNSKDALLETDDKKIWITLEADGERVRLTVEDNGSGLTKEAEKRAFEPFFTTKPLGSGWGLGLSVSLQIVKNHGGEITLSENSPQGTRVVVEFPALKEQA